MKQQEEYVTATEARQLMDISDGKLTTMLRDGEIPWYPNPRNKRAKMIKRSDIDAWLAQAPMPRKPRKPRQLREVRQEAKKGRAA